LNAEDKGKVVVILDGDMTSYMNLPQSIKYFFEFSNFPLQPEKL